MRKVLEAGLSLRVSPCLCGEILVLFSKNTKTFCFRILLRKENKKAQGRKAGSASRNHGTVFVSSVYKRIKKRRAHGIKSMPWLVNQPQ
jgi:hypothetical protein